MTTFEHQVLQRTEEAAAFARVAGGAVLVHADQQDVGVAVHAELLDVLDVAARVALAPELLPRAAPEDRPAFGDRACHRLAVHPRHHQHVAVLGVLHDGRDQPAVVERQRVDLDGVHAQSLTGSSSLGQVLLDLADR